MMGVEANNHEFTTPHVTEIVRRKEPMGVDTFITRASQLLVPNVAEVIDLNANVKHMEDYRTDDAA